MGLTGSPDACAAAAKAYRVYYHRTGDEDYLVDHSIISYLVDPDGRFVTYYGKNVGAAEMAEAVGVRVKEWQQRQAPAQK